MSIFSVLLITLFVQSAFASSFAKIERGRRRVPKGMRSIGTLRTSKERTYVIHP